MQTSLVKWSDSFFLNAKQRDSIERDLKRIFIKITRPWVPSRLHQATVPLQRKHKNRERRDIYHSKTEKEKKTVYMFHSRVDARCALQSLVNRRDIPLATRAFTFPQRERGCALKALLLSMSKSLRAKRRTKPLSTITSEGTLPKNKSL